ncbi:MAG: choice-of-anchor Q domain-containing protein [Daejeonella sp.]
MTGTSFAQTIKYVTQLGAGNKTGTSWANAAPGVQLQNLINTGGAAYIANNPATRTQIWVAVGTYTPTNNPVVGSSDNRNTTFLLKNGVELYGGFAGIASETITTRIIVNNPTILSGDLGILSNSTDNAYHVIVSAGNNNTTILDGFIVEKGNADNDDDDGNGSVIISNNVIIQAWGGGMYNINSSPKIINTVFRNNYARNYGSAIDNYTSNPKITNCLFTNNYTDGYGGAIDNYYGSQQTITNSTFVGNISIDGNCSIFNEEDSHTTIVNSILYNNDNDIEIFNVDADGSSTQVTYSLVQDGYAGTGNIDADPLFENAVTGDFHLKPPSPAINAGSNAAIPAGITLDIDGKPRVLNTTVDMGAYEYIYLPKGANGIIYVKKGGAGNFSGSSWANAVAETGDALEAAGIQNMNANANDDISQVWVATGTYYPIYNPVTGSIDNRDKTFLLLNNVALYGGFAGTESSVIARNIAANPTILSGNINNLAIDTDNTYHVLVSVGNTSSTVLDGFIVEKGYANIFNIQTISGSPVFRDTGSGMVNYHSSPVISNTIFRENFADFAGGGMYNNESSPLLNNVTFDANSATFAGGGMYNELNSSPTITNTKFIGNSVNEYSDGQGGAIYNQQNTSPLITNTLFLNNSAKLGGAMYNLSSVRVSNSTFYGNIAPASGAGSVIADFSSSTITNCIIYINSVSAIITIENGTPAIISNSLVQGGYANGTNIIDVDPLFTNAANGDFSLTPCSPALNIGGPLPAGLVLPATDLAGKPRIYGTAIDLGAYELQAAPTELLILPATIPAGKVNTAYTTMITFNGCGGATTLTLTAGALPGGILFNTATGLLSGTPIVAGTFTFTITAAQNGATVNKDYSLTIIPADVILSGNANLANLSATPGTITPVFAKETLVYHLSVSNDLNSITLTPTLDDPLNATVKVDGIPVNSGTSSGAVNLLFNDNIIRIVVTAQNGAVKTYTLLVRKSPAENPPEVIETTNILSPNGDGINDTFVVTGMLPGNEVIITDRAGRELFRKKDYDNSWDGKIKGVPIQQGICFFVINPRPGSQIITGVITIVR